MPLPWFKRQGEEIPKELEGLEVKDLVDAVNNSKKVTALEADLATTKGQLSEFEATKQRLAALEARVPEPVKKDEPPRPTSFLDDEDKAFNERMAPYMAGMLSQQAQSAKFMARQSLSALDKKIWDKYEGEIDEVMKTVNLAYQANAVTWANALTTIKGRHFDDLRKMENEGTELFAAEAGNNGGGGPAPVNTDKLTDEEKRLAKRMGVKEEDFLASKKEMVVRADSH